MKQRYNIAMLPVDTDLFAQLIHLAQLHFFHIQDHYILGAEGLPHVTLCQFYADTDADALNALRGFVATGVQPVDVHVNSFQVRAGTLINAGKFIAEYNVTKDAPLITLQQSCADYLQSIGIANQTPCDKYAPHFTLARLAEPTDSLPTMDDITAGPHAMRFALGVTSDTGVFVREIGE